MSDIDVIFEAPLARIRLASPARRNAMSRAMWRALPELCATIEARADALVVVVEGAGGHFCAGADISEFAEVYRDAAATHDYVDAIQRG
ncbi:MAG: enoyl-CoA hydratase/isomerase family protein, partial [Roseiarcus sp.]